MHLIILKLKGNTTKKIQIRENKNTPYVYYHFKNQVFLNLFYQWFASDSSLILVNNLHFSFLKLKSFVHVWDFYTESTIFCTFI